MDRKKIVYSCMFPALAVSLAVMLFLLLAEGRTDDNVFVIGGIVFAVTAFILYLTVGWKNAKEQDAAENDITEAEQEETLQLTLKERKALAALKDYDPKAIYEIEDPDTLFKIATLDLNFESMLHQFYSDPFKGIDHFSSEWEKEWSNNPVRFEIMKNNKTVAIDRLNDPDMLNTIIRQDELFAEYAAERLYRIHPEAASKLSEDETAMPAARKAAIRALTDEAELEELYRKCENEELRLVMIGQLSDQAFLNEIAGKAGSKELCTAAARKVTDPKLREQYCREYGTHDWVYEKEERSECGEYLDIFDIYRCRYCGETKKELDERIRM